MVVEIVVAVAVVDGHMSHTCYSIVTDGVFWKGAPQSTNYRLLNCSSNEQIEKGTMDGASGPKGKGEKNREKIVRR